jgi:hypothetical protein
MADLLDIQGNEQSIGDLSLSVVSQADAARKGNTMSDENSWEFWNAALSNPSEVGKSLSVHDGDPHTGFWRVRTGKQGPFVPVAIWRQNGEWIALRNGETTDAEALWTWCCRNPITEEAYYKALDGGGWDDEPAAKTAAKPRGIGDNLPSDPCEALTLEFDGEKELAGEFLKTPITEQAQADRAAVLAKRIAAIAKKATDLHKVEKQPSLDECRRIDDKWRPLKEEPDALSKKLKRHMDDYLREQQRIEQERQRAAAADAERLRSEADEAARAARQSENEYEQAKADRLAREAAEAEREAQAKNAAAGRTGAKVSLRTFVSAKVTDYHAAAKALVDMQHKEFLEFIDQLANRAIRADKTLDGVERVESQRAA